MAVLQHSDQHSPVLVLVNEAGALRGLPCRLVAMGEKAHRPQSQDQDREEGAVEVLEVEGAAARTVSAGLDMQWSCHT